MPENPAGEFKSQRPDGPGLLTVYTSLWGDSQTAMMPAIAIARPCRARIISKTEINSEGLMDSSQGMELVLALIVGIFVLGTLLSGFFQVHTAEAVVVQRMGKFQRVASAGINFKLPWLDQIAGRIDLRVQQLALDVETKTKDNVFVKIPVSVQYHVIADHVYEAFYKLANPRQQISSYVFNVILGHVPKMNLDDAFLQQSDIAVAIKQGLDDVMRTYGYAIDQALVTDIQPDDKVKKAMNEINAAQREQVAATARGEAEKILKVKQAEAEAESKAL
jgi:regulator of protease activity HflC (stomatin/prohibitin superfamily)